jgi:hypothetical protein
MCVHSVARVAITFCNPFTARRVEFIGVRPRLAATGMTVSIGSVHLNEYRYTI